MGSNICCSFSKAEESKLETLNHPQSSRRIIQASNHDDSDEIVMKDFVIPFSNQENLPKSDQSTFQTYTVQNRYNLKKALVKSESELKLLYTIYKPDLISVKDYCEYIEKCKGLDKNFFCVPEQVWQDDENIFIVSEVPTGSNCIQTFVNRKVFSEAEVVNYVKILIPVLESSKNFECFNPEETYFYENWVKIVPHALPRPFFNSPDTRNLYFDSKSQSWTLGILIYLLLCGKSPFKNDAELAETKPVFNFANKHWDSISSLAKNLIMKLLSINPEKRPSLADILKDPWVNKDPNTKNNRKIEKELKKFWKKLALNSAKNELKQFFSVKIANEKGDIRVREIEFSGLGSQVEDNTEVRKNEKKCVLELLLSNFLKEIGDIKIFHSDVANELLFELGYFSDAEVIDGEISMQDFAELILNLLEA